jgi:hypothetical protein
MKDNTSALGLLSELKQSELLGDAYGHILDFEGSSPALDYFVKDVAALLNKILMECNSITGFQVDILHKIFVAFNDIRTKIDPKRLSSFEYCFNDDDELVLFRNTDKGLTNIIINPDECFAFSFIPKNPENQKSLTFYDADYQDFEGLAYRFFS